MCEVPALNYLSCSCMCVCVFYMCLRDWDVVIMIDDGCGVADVVFEIVVVVVCCRH